MQRGGGSSGGGGSGIWVLLTTLLGYLIYPVTLLFGMMQRSLPSSGDTSTQTSSPGLSAAASRGENRLGGSGSGPIRPGGKPAGGQASTSADDVRKRSINSDR